MKEHVHALPAGFRLQEYEILRVLGVGGFGITYLCFDHNLDQARAIKEYLPDDLAVRNSDNTVQWKSTSAKADFEDGLKSFLEEARRLARFEHKNIVQVHRSFSEHGTAYIVMEYAEGDTLSHILQTKGTLSAHELKNILLPILEGLEEVHKDLIHRDIKPANIIIRDVDASPVLLDFGSARQAISSKSKSMTAIVTAGFAPIEQYSTQGHQGPWTDIYALGCLCYRALTGEIPVEAPLRVRNDPLIPIGGKLKGRVDPHFQAAIEWALQVHEEDRPQSIREWRESIFAGLPGGSAAGVERAEPTQHVTPAPQKKRPVALVAAITAALAIAAAGGGYFYLNMDTPNAGGIVLNENVDDGASTGSDAIVPPDGDQVPEEPGATEALLGGLGTLVANRSPFPDITAAGVIFRDQLEAGILGPEMVTIPAGEFAMGNRRADGDSDEAPVHDVRVPAFAMSIYEVDFPLYDAFATATGRSLPADEGWGRDGYPVINVTWSDAVAFTRWLSEQAGVVYRLPSEAEWEYAARAGSFSRYPWGDGIGGGMANCSGCGAVPAGRSMMTGSFPANAFGVHDLQGNVWEWTLDCARDSYLGAPTDGGAWASEVSGCSRIVRGGSWGSTPYELRSSYRNWMPAEDAGNTIGIRLVRELN